MRIVFTIVIVLYAAHLFAQNTPSVSIPHGQSKTAAKDTTTKEARYFYLSVNGDIYVNTKGSITKRFSPSVEFGRTLGIFDIGLSIGRLNSFPSGRDTSLFVEFRPTLNIFSKGRFSEALCLGGGYVFNSKQALMTEVCNSINFNVSEILAIAVLQGYYYFDGTNSSRSTLFFGINVTYNFLKKHGVNLQRKKATFIDN